MGGSIQERVRGACVLPPTHLNDCGHPVCMQRPCGLDVWNTKVTQGRLSRGVRGPKRTPCVCSSLLCEAAEIRRLSRTFASSN